MRDDGDHVLSSNLTMVWSVEKIPREPKYLPGVHAGALSSANLMQADLKSMVT